MKLFSQYVLGNIRLKNRMVMAPLTRSRAIGNIPNELMTKYYQQRATAGLIITEGVAPSANGLGYARIPGIYNQAQIDGWKHITKAVHEEGGKIFIQLMHTGRVSHPDNMESGTRIIAPSPIALSGEMHTNQQGMQPYPIPEAMSTEHILQAQNEYVWASENAMTAGFDGIEIHGANGYLIDQFINPASNQREDIYGGSIENRSRFTIEVARKIADAIGPDRVGIRLSPYGVFNDMEIFEGVEDTFEYIATTLGKMELAYIHTVDHSSMGAPEVPESIKQKMRNAFRGTFIVSGGFDKPKAEAALQSDKGDLVAFGQPFLANPDLVYRLENDLPLNTPDPATFYTPGEKGYTDYPFADKPISTV